MKKIRITGIVVGEQTYSESSKILKIFAKDYGIISVLAKGAKNIKSPFKEASNKLIYGEFDITYRTDAMSTLVSASIIKIFKNIVMDYHDLDRKMYAFYITDLMNQVIKQDKDNKEINEAYDIYLSSLYKIDEKLNPKIIYDIVKLKYLELLGVKPSIDSCSNCGSKDNIITCASTSFGFICKNCYSNEIIIKEESLKMIRMLYYVDINKIKKLDIDKDILKEVETFLDNYYEEHTGIYFKSKKSSEILSKINGVIN